MHKINHTQTNVAQISPFYSQQILATLWKPLFKYLSCFFLSKNELKLSANYLLMNMHTISLAC